MNIYDVDGNLKDWDWLHAKYGDIRVLDAGPGTKFKIVNLRETCAPSTLLVTTRNEDGSLILSQPIANYWPNQAIEGNTVRLTDSNLKSIWRPTANIQYTSGDEASTGFGLGPGSYYVPGPDSRGPHVVWVLSPTYPSDAVDGQGMLPKTDHWGMLRAEFILTQNTTPELPPPSTGSIDLEPIITELRGINTALSALARHLGAL